eukprot:gene12159-16849_t
MTPGDGGLCLGHNVLTVALAQNGLTDKGLELMLPALKQHPRLSATRG